MTISNNWVKATVTASLAGHWKQSNLPASVTSGTPCSANLRQKNPNQTKKAPNCQGLKTVKCLRIGVNSIRSALLSPTYTYSPRRHCTLSSVSKSTSVKNTVPNQVVVKPLQVRGALGNKA